MADTKISAMSAASALGGTEKIPAVQSDANVALTPAQIATYVKDTAFSGALVRKASDQAGANYTTETALAWDQEAYDVGGWHDNVTNNSRLTVPAGVSRVRLVATVLVNNTSQPAQLVIKKAGAAFDGQASNTAPIHGAIARCNAVTGVIAVSQGDYFEAFLQVNTDTSVDVVAVNSSFSIEKVS